MRIFGTPPGVRPPVLKAFAKEVDGIVKAHSECTGEIIHLEFDLDRKVWWKERDRPGRLPAFCCFFRWECRRLYNTLLLSRREEIEREQGESEELVIKINSEELAIPMFVSSDCVFLDKFIDAMLHTYINTAKQPAICRPGPLPSSISQCFSQIRRPIINFEDLYWGLLRIDDRDTESWGTPRDEITPSDYDGAEHWPQMIMELFDELTSNNSLHEEYLILVGHWKLGGVPEDLVDINVDAMRFEEPLDQSYRRLRNRLVYVKGELDLIRNHMQDLHWEWLEGVRYYDEDHPEGACEAIKWLSVHVPPYGHPKARELQPDTKSLHSWTAQHWLETHEGQKWLLQKCDASFPWLRTWWGRHWLAETPAGEAFLETTIGKFFWVMFGDYDMPKTPRIKEYSFSVLPLGLLRKPPFGFQRSDWLASHMVAPRKVRFVEFAGYEFEIT